MKKLHPVDSTVSHTTARLATSDFGGDGPALVLMHGLGMKRSGLARIAGHLPDFRVITMDLRGHGDSSSVTAPWSFEDAVDDLAAVVEHHRLDRPLVGGHSLGGMVALRYALDGHATAGVVNIDGWGPGVATRYLGEDLARVEQQLEQYRRGEWPNALSRFLVERTRHSREGTTTAVLELLHGVDIVAWHRQAPCPSLAFNATASPPWVFALLLGRELARLQDAHRRGLSRDLAAVAAERADVRVVDVDATHSLYATHAALVADAIREFARP